MAFRFSSLRSLATKVLQDIDNTPVCVDASTQTDELQEEEILSVLRKRKNELIYVIDDLLRDKEADATFAYNLKERRLSMPTGKTAPTKALIAASNYVDYSHEGDTDEASCAETAVSEDSAVESGKKSAITWDTDVQEDKTTRRRKKLMREVAAYQGVEYNNESDLNEIYKGRTNQDLVAMMPDSSPERERPVRTTKVDLTGMMDVPSITKEQYFSLSKDGKRKYVAAVVIRLKELAETHGPPLSVRAVSTMYNIDYNSFYDSWSGRKSNPYIK
jgi:hypothetical protein